MNNDNRDAEQIGNAIINTRKQLPEMTASQVYDAFIAAGVDINASGNGKGH